MLWQRAIIKDCVIKSRIGREVWVMVEDRDENKVHLIDSTGYKGRRDQTLPINIIQHGYLQCAIPPKNVEMCSGPDDFRETVPMVVYEDSVWYQEMLDWKKENEES